MRKSRIGALVASTALASASLLAGAGVANASVEDLIGSVDVFGSLQSEQDDGATDEPAGPTAPAAVDSAEIVATSTGIVKEGEEADGDPRYTLSATAYDNCTVAFTLVDGWGDDYPTEGKRAGWRADYRVGAEDAVMPAGSSRGAPTYRPVVVGNDTIANAVQGRDNPYDIAANKATVDLTKDRIIPDAEDVSQTIIRDGVEPNDDGRHVVTFGMYQGPNTATSGLYSFDTDVTVTGCPTTEDDEVDDGDEAGKSPLGSLDVFGSLSS